MLLVVIKTHWVDAADMSRCEGRLNEGQLALLVSRGQKGEYYGRHVVMLPDGRLVLSFGCFLRELQ